MAPADDSKGGKPAGSGGRERRLAAALRENLRRRKAQLRERGANPDKNPRRSSEPDGKTRV
jgi:hypothetical protein